MADVCLVSSLADGMNLVAKEFVAARESGDGILILSEFAGVAREFQEALKSILTHAPISPETIRHRSRNAFGRTETKNGPHESSSRRK